MSFRRPLHRQEPPQRSSRRRNHHHHFESLLIVVAMISMAGSKSMFVTMTMMERRRIQAFVVGDRCCFCGSTFHRSSARENTVSNRRIQQQQQLFHSSNDKLPSHRRLWTTTTTTTIPQPTRWWATTTTSVRSAATKTTEPSLEEEENIASPILLDLNPSQITAVTQPLESITRVVAGPGSGKTRVLTSRIAWLLQQQDQQHRQTRILGVTFTRKAASEMQVRLEKLLRLEQQYQEQSQAATTTENSVFIQEEGDVDPTTIAPPGLDRVTLGTFHSICAKILRWNGEYLPTLPSVMDDMSKSPNEPLLDRNFNIADQAEQIRIIKDVLAEQNIDLKPLDLKPLQVLTAVSRCKAMIMQGENPFSDMIENGGKKTSVSASMKIAQKIYYPCREKLLSTNCIDFDDLIYLARELLLIHDDIRERLQKRWDHILVDEFQDTSQTQMDLIKLLSSKSLFVVGDADQSIYSWRGAHAGSLSDFEHEFHAYNSKGVSTVYLMENYRSTSNIVKAAQKVISASPGTESGADKLRQKMIPKRSAGAKPRIMSCEDGKAEAQFVVKSVTEKIALKEYGPDHSVAFIYRTNAQSRELEEACVQHNLPYVIFGSATSFYKRQEIKDCLCFFRWLYNGRDRTAMLRAIETPKRGIGDTAIREFDEYCGLVDQLWDEQHPGAAKPTPLEVLFHLSGDNSWTSMKDPQFPPPSVSISTRPLKLLKEFSRQMVAMRSVAKVGTVEDVLTFIVTEMNLIPHLDKISKSKSEFEERQANVQELQQASRRYSESGPCLPENTTTISSGEDYFNQSPLGTFLDDVALVTDMADSNEGSNEDRFLVSFMTIHASKGMEFDTVYFVGIEDGTLPTSQALQEGMGSVVYEEEKRLCYVAMTRAKSELVMSWRQEVPIFSSEGIRMVSRKRSRFLDVLVSKEESKPRDQSPTGRSRLNQSQKTYGGFGSNSISTSKGTQPPSPRRKSDYASPVPLKSNPTPRKLTGTASVYAQRNISPLDSIEAQPALQKRTASTKRISSTTVTTPHTAAMRRHSTSMGSIGQLVPKQQPLSTTAKSMDSTWFFPVGSKVRHSRLGEGVVLPPQNVNDNNGAMTVIVKFRNGDKREFPVQTAELSPIVH